MNTEPEDFERLMNAARLEEARAKAEKAREEARHERSKREKTERETEFMNHSKWHDGIRAFSVFGTFCVAVGGLVLKMRGKKVKAFRFGSKLAEYADFLSARYLSATGGRSWVIRRERYILSVTT